MTVLFMSKGFEFSKLSEKNRKILLLSLGAKQQLEDG